MNKFLEDLLKSREAELKDLEKRNAESEDINEVRGINKQINKIEDEIRSIKNEINSENVKADNLDPLGSYGIRNKNLDNNYGEGIDSYEYRTAFKDLILHNKEIPNELRANQTTKTGDVTSAIPTILVNQIIEKMDNVGMILPLVTRTSYKGGVNIPTSNVKPVATWVAEGATSDRQKKTTGKIVFAYHKLRCEIAMTMEVGTMALSAFEATFVQNVVKAMTKAIEEAIIKGDGNGKPTGILNETPEEGQVITLKKADKLTYKVLTDAEGAVPEECEASAKWCMSKRTFMQFIGMTDANGQPIARVNYGLNGVPERTLLGREVVLASTYLPTYADTVEAETTFAFIFDFSDYTLNTIYDMGIQSKQDWDTEDYLTKAVMSVDGKVVDKTSLVVLTKTVA